MASLLVRNVDPDLARLLRTRAAQHGRSAEAEHRLILEAALRGGRGRSGLDLWRALSEGPRLSAAEEAAFAAADELRHRPPRDSDH